MGEEWGDKIILYLYDASGSPIGMMYRQTDYDINKWDTFWFEKNLQGDVVAVYNSSGDKVATYTYSDAWGNHSETYFSLATNEGVQYNPFRYRGYYYDRDLSLYYLNSRYYDAHTGRFISPDNTAILTATPIALTDKNLYAYCDNNPVMRVDGDGDFWESFFDVASLVFSVADVIANPYDVWAWAGLVGDVVDLIPFVSGVGEATDLLRLAVIGGNIIEAADDVHDTLNIADGAIDTYKNLRKINKGNGLEVHHIVEKRFAKKINGMNTNDMLSIALTHDEHVVFTRQWRQAIQYGSSYDIDDIWNAAQNIYANYPALLEAARKTLGR